MNVLSMVRVPDVESWRDDWLATVEIRFRCRTVTVKYRGGCTVWHRYPSGTRAATWREGWLYNAWQIAKWKEEDDKR